MRRKVDETFSKSYFLDDIENVTVDIRIWRRTETSSSSIPMNIDQRRLERLFTRGKGSSIRSDEEKVRRGVTSRDVLFINLFIARPT